MADPKAYKLEISAHGLRFVVIYMRLVQPQTGVRISRLSPATKTKGPTCTGQIFVYFAKKSVMISVVQVRMEMFSPPNFVKPYQTSKALSSCFEQVKLIFC